MIYVDEILLFGKNVDQLDFHIILKFKCKEVKWLSKDRPMDHLGVTLYEDDDYILDFNGELHQEYDDTEHARVRPYACPIHRLHHRNEGSER